MSTGVGLMATVALLCTPQPVRAQSSICAVAGEYVLAAILLSPPGPAQVGGLFVFVPPSACGAGAVGSVAVDVVFTTSAGPVRYQSTLMYRVDGTSITIGEGFLYGSITGLVDGIATSVPINGSGNLQMAGTLVRRTIEGGVGPRGLDGPPGATGATGPTGPAGATGSTGGPGPGGTPGIPGPSGPQGISGNVGPAGPTGPAGPATAGAMLLTGGTGREVAVIDGAQFSGPGVGEISNDVGHVQVPVPAGTLRRLIVRTSTFPFIDTTLTVTVVGFNGSATGISCSITGFNNGCVDLVGEYTTGFGEPMSIRIEQTGAGAGTATRVTYSLEFHPS